MPRYATIDNDTGYVWGVVDAETPLAAVELISEEVGDNGRYDFELATYGSGESGFIVYEMATGFDVADGQDDAQIASVRSGKRVAFIKSLTRED